MREPDGLSPAGERPQSAHHPRSAELPELRLVSDAQTLRALTHPTRIALIETLSIHGPMTATEAAEHVGESPSSCSFHLRQLARYGFVEEAGGGQGRRRPWKMTSLGMRFSSVHADPETEVAAAALSSLIRERQLGRYRAWLRTRGSYPPQWRAAAVDDEHVFWVTAEELTALSQRLLTELLPLHRERLDDPSRRPPGALPVELLVLGYPIVPPRDTR
ncbi:MAG TPA: helix-turn-helix domain-containing protein [Solirubrobacteraceae bacterium]|nr:helix-turn-helix domain-containing protein [Solirubrobacteraceae bacterium]